MKKSIKYAGIAAATLLTVAPIAAPVVSNVTTVKADESNVTPDTTKLADALKGFTDNFGDEDATDYIAANPQVPANFTFGAANQMSYANFIASPTAQYLARTNAAISAGNKTYVGDAQATAFDAYLQLAGTNQANVRNIYVTASAGSKNINTVHDLQTIISDNDQPEVAFVLHYTYTDTDGVSHDTTKAFKAERTDDDKLTSVNAKFTTPYNVALNQKVTDSQLISGTDFKVTDQNGKGLLSGDPTPSEGYYYTYTSALMDTNVIDDANVVSQPNNGAISEFKKAGTYYQAITITAAANTSLRQFITDYDNDPTSNPIYVNGKVASAGTDFAVNDANHTIRFVRAINVSNDSSQWTTTDTTGVVTTKTDHNYYTLKDDNNSSVSNRALYKNTAWKTNAVRVDQNGNKQYRVGASEWIDANDVTFSDKATDNNNGEGAYTDVKALNGKVVTAGPSGFYYPLYNDNGKMISDRGVAGLSAWYTDKSAVNADGVTVYHVATGEWLQGTNATYSAY